jgi:hypothetical protein
MPTCPICCVRFWNIFRIKDIEKNAKEHDLITGRDNNPAIIENYYDEEDIKLRDSYNFNNYLKRSEESLNGKYSFKESITNRNNFFERKVAQE